MKDIQHLALLTALPVFKGRTEDGELIVRREATEYHIDGICYRLDAENERLSLKKQRSARPSACERESGRGPMRSLAEVILARGVNTAKLFVIRGKVNRAIDIGTFPPQTAMRQPMSVAQYQVEVQRIKASQELGIDPVVSLPFLMRHSGRSAATVYRDINAQRLPKPFKRGASSVWSFSAAQTYAHGQRPGQVDAPF